MDSGDNRISTKAHPSPPDLITKWGQKRQEDVKHLSHPCWPTDSVAQTLVSLSHWRLFPFTHRRVKNAKIPKNAVEKTYREGQGCTQKAQVGQEVIRQSSQCCRGRQLAESTKHESRKGKCAEHGLSRAARRGTWGWKENPPAGGNEGKLGGKHTWSVLGDARWVPLEGCSLPPPPASPSTPTKTLLSPSRSEKQILRENLLGGKCSFRSVKMTWKYGPHFPNSLKCL